MSEQQIPLTAEVIFEMLRRSAKQSAEEMREIKRMFQETDRIVKETAEQMKRTDKKISDLGYGLPEMEWQCNTPVREFQISGNGVLSFATAGLK